MTAAPEPRVRTRTVRIDGTALVECFDDRRRSDHSTRFVARHLRIAPGSVVAEVGCGTGVLATFAALRGAARAWATDVDPVCVALAERTALANGAGTVRAVVGGLLAPVPRTERIDVVVAVMPQKPATAEFSKRYAGGTDGADLLVALVRECAARLVRGARFVLYHHSIAAPARVESALGEAFDLRTLATRTRCVSRRKYAELAPGMLDHVLALAAAGTIVVRERGACLEWDTRVIEAVRR